MIESEFAHQYAKFSTADCARSSNCVKPQNLIKLCEAPEANCFHEESIQNYEIQVAENLNPGMQVEPMMLKC